MEFGMRIILRIFGMIILATSSIFAEVNAIPSDSLKGESQFHSPIISSTHDIAQGGDTIEEATLIPSLPYSSSGTTVGYTHNYDEWCPYDSFAPDVVYVYVPTFDQIITITLCSGSEYDTKLYVYENEETPMDPVACNDDACESPNYPHGPYVSRLDNVSLAAGNNYYIIVDGYGTEAGFYTIDIHDICCVVEMNPDEDPVIVSRGDTFGLTGYAINPTSQHLETDIWIMLDVPYNGLYGPLHVFQDIQMVPHDTLAAHIYQYVPYNAPLGTYDYIAYCGDRPDTKCDSAEFPFTVSGTRLADGATEWSFDGNFLGEELIPTEFALDNAYPNPFNATATISYQLPEASRVNLDIYNVLGQRVTTLVNGNVEAGYHSVSWDASGYSSGIYFYKLAVGDRVFTKRMTLLK
ncbi:MAG: T9SS type A sorting domain-containing protein [candidate division Zixibacteria bacterium]|nr:T9SS type A sorting domain-containing protein [candidate division Zixibacteria bacterium]